MKYLSSTGSRIFSSIILGVFCLAGFAAQATVPVNPTNFIVRCDNDEWTVSPKGSPFRDDIEYNTRGNPTRGGWLNDAISAVAKDFEIVSVSAPSSSISAASPAATVSLGTRDERAYSISPIFVYQTVCVTIGYRNK